MRNEKVDAVSARISNEVPHLHLTGEPSSRLASVTSQRFPHLGQGLDITIQHRTKKGNWICLVPQQLSRGLFGLHCVERGDDARGMNRPLTSGMRNRSHNGTDNRRALQRVGAVGPDRDEPADVVIDVRNVDRLSRAFVEVRLPRNRHVLGQVARLQTGHEIVCLTKIIAGQA